eukprot:scaffold10335_cov34-Prasinocladus_malaysianus.AAC.1
MVSPLRIASPAALLWIIVVNLSCWMVNDMLWETAISAIKGGINAGLRWLHRRVFRRRRFRVSEE